MQPNVSKIRILIEKHFNGNQSAFSKALGVERSQISGMLNHGKFVGAKFFGALIAYCIQNDLDFQEYIFLPEVSKR